MVSVERVDPVDELLIGFVTMFPEIALRKTRAFLCFTDAVGDAYLFRGQLMADTLDPNLVGLERKTRCPKAICGHRFPCPVVSVLIFFGEFFM